MRPFGSRGSVTFDRMSPASGTVPMLLRRLPVIIATPLARRSQQGARENAASAAREARRRRQEQEDADAFVERLLSSRRPGATARRP